MKTESKIDPFVTPVWALYSNGEIGDIIHGVLPRHNTRNRSEPVPRTAMYSEGGIWTSRSRWFSTKEELIADEGIRPACSECGSPFSTHWCDPLPKLLTERNLCFTCNHWIHTVMPRYGKPGNVIIGHSFYNWDPNRPVKQGASGEFMGYGGRTFHIRIASGEVVETNNLWHGGEIPKRFWEKMPDDATFEKTPEPIGHGMGYLG